MSANMLRVSGAFGNISYRFPESPAENGGNLKILRGSATSGYPNIARVMRWLAHTVRVSMDRTEADGMND